MSLWAERAGDVARAVIIFQMEHMKATPLIHLQYWRMGRWEVGSRACLRLFSLIDAWNCSISLPGGGQSGRRQRLDSEDDRTGWQEWGSYIEKECEWQVGAVEVVYNKSCALHKRTHTHAYIMLSVTAFRHIYSDSCVPSHVIPFEHLIHSCGTFLVLLSGFKSSRPIGRQIISPQKKCSCEMQIGKDYI